MPLNSQEAVNRELRLELLDKERDAFQKWWAARGQRHRPVAETPYLFRPISYPIGYGPTERPVGHQLSSASLSQVAR